MKRRETLQAVFSFALVLLLFFLVLRFSFRAPENEAFYKQCPRIQAGNPNASLHIRYFDNPYCPYCIREEPILQKALAQKGEKFFIERYDIRFCKEQVARDSVPGTPTFIFRVNNTREWMVASFIPEKNLFAIIDEMGGAE